MIDPNKLIHMISNKEDVLKKVIEIMQRNQKQLDGCTKLRESLVREEDPNHSQANLVRCIEVSLATSAKNSQDLLDLSQFILVYVQGDNFTQDVAKIATKLGKGNEALQAMLRAKMGGK